MASREVPASIGQRLVWFLDHYRAEESSVNCPAVFRITGAFDRARVEPVLETVLRRHESLRTTLRRHGRELVQVIHDPAPVAVNHIALAGGTEEELQRRLGAELRTAIPLHSSPARITLWRIGGDHHVLCVNMHHLASDAWSCGVVINDVIDCLSAAPGADPVLRPVGWQYAQFAEWQHEQARTGALRAHQEYWTGQLHGLELPALPRRPGAEALAHPRPALATDEIPGVVGDGLRALARAERTTLFSVLLAVYYLLLHRQTGQSDVAVASFFANRTRREVQHTVGFFANMLVLRTRLRVTQSFRELVAAARQTVTDAVVHQAVPCQMLPMPSLLRSPGRVNDVVFQMLPDRTPEAWAPTRLAPGLEIDTFRPSQGLSRFGLNLTVIPRGDRVDTRLSYAEDQFDAAWARRLLAGYGALAAWVLARPDAALREVSASLVDGEPVDGEPVDGEPVDGQPAGATVSRAQSDSTRGATLGR